MELSILLASVSADTGMEALTIGSGAFSFTEGVDGVISFLAHATNNTNRHKVKYRVLLFIRSLLKTKLQQKSASLQLLKSMLHHHPSRLLDPEGFSSTKHGLLLKLFGCLAT